MIGIVLNFSKNLDYLFIGIANWQEKIWSHLYGLIVIRNHAFGVDQVRFM